MSVTVHQILNDAKRLVSRLKDHDSAADCIISQTQTLYKNVEAMKEYNEDVSDHNIANQIRSRPLVVFNMQQENKHILELQQENRELRDLLEEHQSVLQLIMSKYRQQVTKLVNCSSKENRSDHNSESQDMQKMADSICELADAMKQAIEIDDVFYVNEHERVSALIAENKGLRELLEISQTYGSLANPLNPPEMADKESQTDT